MFLFFLAFYSYFNNANMEYDEALFLQVYSRFSASGDIYLFHPLFGEVLRLFLKLGDLLHISAARAGAI